YRVDEMKTADARVLTENALANVANVMQTFLKAKLLDCARGPCSSTDHQNHEKAPQTVRPIIGLVRSIACST
ncbi:hypothetical protein, partial [Rhizobium rhizogenes]|uniref:hypothetical protein n=1 Tax=Rhizobium rhizogenes TaxID=359 RepID=UPI001AED36A5